MRYLLVPKTEDVDADTKAMFMLSGDLTRVAQEITRDEAAKLITSDRPQFANPASLSLVLSPGSFSLTDGRTIVIGA